MEMSKILADRYDLVTLSGMVTSSSEEGAISDVVGAAGGEETGMAGTRCGGKVPGSGGKKRRRRRSLASRNLDEMELQLLRQKINGRERQRMHDLNSALDGLREVTTARLCATLYTIAL